LLYPTYVTDQSSAAISATFVSSAYTTIPVDITIPKTGTYKIQIYTIQGGQGIWWNSIAMAIGGTTTASFSANNMGYFDNSYVASIRSDGNDITP